MFAKKSHCKESNYGLDDRGFESREGLRILLFTIVSIPDLGITQLPIQWVRGTLSLEAKNAWSYTSIPQYAFVSWCLVEAHGLYRQYFGTYRNVSNENCRS